MVSNTSRLSLQYHHHKHTEDESISSIPLSTHSAVEMLHDSALHKSIIDIDETLYK